MTRFQEFQERITTEINNLDFNTEPHNLYEPINYSLRAGGKRIRPVLTLLACDLFSGNIENAIKPAIAYEIFHNFTLIHDDIMDKSDVRRNNPTVHKKWNNNVAILSGDAMMIKSYEFLLDLEPNTLKKVLEIFNQTALAVCEGQQYDMDFESYNDISIEKYLTMIKLKTSVLIAACLKSGAIIGGANNIDANLIYDFGINIGLAFQLKDDLLDVYGDFEIFGKEIGKDILANKKTFLLINALNNADAETRNKIESWLLRETFNSSEKVKEITKIYNKLNIKNLVENSISLYFDKAYQCIKHINVEAERKIDLIAFAQELQSRTY